LSYSRPLPSYYGLRVRVSLVAAFTAASEKGIRTHLIAAKSATSS